MLYPTQVIREMIWAAVLMPGLCTLSACGGATRGHQAGAGATGESSAGAGSGAGAVAGSGAGAGTGVGGASGSTVEALDGAGARYPAAPPGSGAFFWHGGLGNWFMTSADGSQTDSQLERIDPSRPESGEAHHVSSEPGSPGAVGAVLWAQLNHPQGAPVDLSGYTGLSFRARAIGFDELIVTTNGNGGYFRDLSLPPIRRLSVSQDWQHYFVTFDQLEVERSAISSFDFVIVGRGKPFDLWVGDVTLTCDGTCP
jgi:hypothetical protein